jgi:hypothetical protein
MIPNRILRTVPEVTSPQVDDWAVRLAHLHPGWEIITFRDPLDPDDWPLTAAAWASCVSGAQRAGLIRLEALWRFGGIYVDSDVEPFAPFDQLRACHAFATWEDDQTIPDFVLGAEPGHPAMGRCLELALDRIGDGPWASGPGVTTEVMRGRSDVMLLPPSVFAPVHYTARRDLPAYAAGPKPPWNLAMHRWFGSWLPPEMRL